MPCVMPLRLMSVMLGMVAPNPMIHRRQGCMAHIGERKCAEHTARGQQEQNPSHKLQQPSFEKTILFEPPEE